MKKLLVLSVLVSTSAMANLEYSYDDEIALANEAITTSPLNIEGTYSNPAYVAPVAAPKKLTSSERLRKRRAKLEARNRIMLEKRIEQIRYKQELMLAKQLEAQMNKTLKALDKIQ